jgi:hypothetical protein
MAWADKSLMSACNPSRTRPLLWRSVNQVLSACNRSCRPFVSPVGLCWGCLSRINAATVSTRNVGDHTKGQVCVDRRLISVAVGSFSGALADKPLPFAHQLQSDLREAVHGVGYETSSDSLARHLTCEEIADLVGQAITDAKVHSTDDAPAVLVVHALSHGCEYQDAVYVYGSDSQISSRTSLNSWLAEASIGEIADPEGPRPWVLFLVDVCGAGTATTQSWQLTVADETRRVWVIAGTMPDLPAFNGWFTQATVTVLSNLASLDVGTKHQHVPLPPIAQAIRREVRRLAGRYPQRVVATRIDMATDVHVPPFFENPNYGLTYADQGPAHLREFVTAVDELVDPWHVAMRAVDELVDPWHFATRAAGVTPEYPGPLTEGWFHGRGEHLRSLSAWLVDASGVDSIKVVTGSPGCGKSALLGMVVCAAHPKLSALTHPLWRDRQTDLPAATLENLVAVHARERDVDAVCSSILRQLTVPDVGFGEPLRWLRLVLEQRTAPPPIVIVDALDEAAQPVQLSDVLLDLAGRRRADGSPLCRVLVGTRSGSNWPIADGVYAEALTQDGLIDLDRVPRDELRTDLTDYVEGLLRAHPVYGQDEYAAARTTVAQTVADSLTADPVATDPRWGEFLVAGLFTRYITGLDPIADVTQAEAEAAKVPRTLPAVLELELSQRAHPWIRPVLATIAHAFGDGIPRSLIAACASVFAPAGLGEPTEADITEAIKQIQFYLRREVDSDGVNVYRLFQEALTEHLRAVPRAPSSVDG